MDNRTPVIVLYTNHRGETALRRILPVKVYFGKTAYHPDEDQWLMDVFDLDKEEWRTYAMRDIHGWYFGNPTDDPKRER